MGFIGARFGFGSIASRKVHGRINPKRRRLNKKV